MEELKFFFFFEGPERKENNLFSLHLFSPAAFTLGSEQKCLKVAISSIKTCFSTLSPLFSFHYVLLQSLILTFLLQQILGK